MGKLGGGNDISRTRNFSFTKGVGPKLIEVSFSSQDNGDGLIQEQDRGLVRQGLANQHPPFHTT